MPSGKKLIEDKSIEIVVVDATEVEIERPQKNRKKYYSEKKKRHTLKIQIITDEKKKIFWE